MPLRLRPTYFSALETRVTGLGQPQNLTAPVGRIRLDRDQVVALEGPDIAAERRAIHDQIRRERVDRHRALALEPREDPILGGAQPGGRQIPIVELGDVAGSLAQGEAVAIGRIWKRCRNHGQPLGKLWAVRSASVPILCAYTPFWGMLKSGA